MKSFISTSPGCTGGSRRPGATARKSMPFSCARAIVIARFLLVVVRNLDIRRVAIDPAKADAPLVIDADAPLPGPILLQKFQPITWRNSQTLDAGRCVNLLQFA